MIDNATLYELLAFIREDSYFDCLTELKSFEQLDDLTLEEAKSVIDDSSAASRVLKLSVYLDPRYRNSDYKNELIKFLEEVTVLLDDIDKIQVRNELKNIIFEYQHNLVLLRKLFGKEENILNDKDIDNLPTKELFSTDDYLKLLSVMESKEGSYDANEISMVSHEEYVLNYSEIMNRFQNYKNNTSLSGKSILNLNLKVDDFVSKENKKDNGSENDEKPKFRVKI